LALAFLTVCLVISLCVIWSYIVPVNVIHVDKTEDFEVEYCDDTYVIQMPTEYLQLPTVRAGLPLRVTLYAGPDPVAEQIAEIIRERFPTDSSKWLAWDVAMFIRQNIQYEQDDWVDRWKLPWETVRDGRGDCEDMACLMLSILGYLGIDAVFVVSQNHASVAVDTEGYDDYTVEYSGKTYRCISPMGAYLPGQYECRAWYAMPPGFCMADGLGLALALLFFILVWSGLRRMLED